jgi:hypothetical protein
MPTLDELRKDLYAGGDPEIGYGDSPGTGLEIQDSESPQRLPWDFSGRKSPGMFDLKYGEAKETLDLDWIYTPGAMKMSHVKKFVNLNTEENERFAYEVLMDKNVQPVLEGMRKPTMLEYVESSEQRKTEMRRTWYRDNINAVKGVAQKFKDVASSAWDRGMKVMKSQAVADFQEIARTKEQTLYEYPGVDQKDRGLARTISKVEGTDETALERGYNSGYDVTLGYGQFDPEWFDSKKDSLENLAVGEVINLQTDILNHPDNDMNSSAVGKWQLTRRTLRDLIKRKVIDVSMSDKFTPELQDKIFYALVERRGYSAYLAGKLPKDEFMQNLKKEWEGLDRFKSDLPKILDRMKEGDA